MFDYIMVRYGEIGTKGKNKKLFIRKLKQNIVASLSHLDEVRVYNKYDRIYIKGKQKKEIVELLKNISGIHSFALVKHAKNLEILLEKTLESAQNFDKSATFKINTKRGDKTYYLNSMEITRKVAGNILDNIDLKVDVKNPDNKLNIELRNEGFYFYENMIEGMGGYPNETIGKGLVLLSGGIDSPVAAYKMIRRGLKC